MLEALPQPPPQAVADWDMRRVLVRLAGTELMPEGGLLVEVAKQFCPSMDGHDIRMNRAKAIIVFEFPTPTDAWRAQQALQRAAPQLLGLSARDVQRVVRVSIAPKAERHADNPASENSVHQPPPPPPPPMQQQWQPQQHPYQQQQQVMAPPPGGRPGLDGRPFPERQYDGYLGAHVAPGQQHPQQHMYAYGETPPGLAPAPPHLQHLPPQLHLQQPMAVPHDPRRPQGPPPGLPPGPHMPLGSSLPPGLGGAAPPLAPMDPRQRGAAGAHPLPQVVVAGSVPLGGMPPPTGGECMDGGVHGLTQPVAAVPGAAEASSSLPAKLVLVLRVWLLRVGRYAPQVTHAPHNQPGLLSATQSACVPHSCCTVQGLATGVVFCPA